MNEELQQEIAERKRAEEELINLKNFKQEIVDKSPLGIFRLDSDLRLIYENAAAKKIMGVPDEEESKALGMDVRDIPSVVEAGISDEFNKLPMGEEIIIECPFKSIYGRETFLRMRGVPVYRRKNFDGAILLIEDITKPKIVEAALQKSEEKHRNLIENANDGIVTVDLQGAFTFVNKKGEEISGYKREELIGQPLSKLVCPEYLPLIFKRLGARAQGKKAEYRYEIEIFNKSGERIPIEIVTNLIIKDGKPVGSQVIVRDITMRKELERALRESEEKYRTLVESSSDVIFTVDTQGKFTFFNKKVRDVTGFTAEELVGRNFVEILPKGSQKKALKFFSMGMKGEAGHMYEIEVNTKGGGSLVVELNMTTLFDDGRVVGRLGIARDISEKKRLQERLIHSAKLASVGQLAAGVAHEINTPLANISLATEALKEGELRGPVNKKLDSILDQVNTISKIVNNLLDFSRLKEPKTRDVDIRVLLDKALDMLSMKLKKIEVKKKLPPDPVVISGDPNQLLQVFVNIILNASQAMPHGGKLEIAVNRNKEFIETVISDTGTGIHAKDIPNIFDPFFTKKGVSNGTGLGLSIAHGIIEGHNGAITVDSSVGGGSTFTIKLPLGGGNA